MNFCHIPLSRMLILTVATGLTLLAARAEAMGFRISAVGYHSQGTKVAVLEDVPADSREMTVTLFDPARRNPRFPLTIGATVHKITKVRVIQEKNGLGPATNTILLDFSDFKTPGTYELRVDGMPIRSEPLKITDYLYWDALKPLIRSFYFQRCGQEIEAHELNLYHAACHVADAKPIRPEITGKSLKESGNEGLDVAGGWHNGGDYAKYVTSTALAAARLMAMSEWEPRPFRLLRLDYPIDEPGYGSTDDFHHEIRTGLDWLMSMQRKDGALWRKVAGRRWPEPVKPEDDTQTRYVYGVSTQDTAAAAATWAMAARSFRKADLGYSVKNLMTAEKAWEYLESQPRFLAQRTGDDYSGSGEFFDTRNGTDLSYRLWAAAELYITTGKPRYHTYFLDHLGKVPVEPFSWRNPALQGILDYLLYAENQDSNAAATLKKAILLLADGIMEETQADAYGAGLRRYGPSSNPEIAERGAALMAAYRLSGESRYRDAATRTVSYFFGINPLGMTYVTGLPGKAVQHPAHRWMERAGKSIPGFLVDGPNETASDGKTPKNQGAESYADDAAAVASNEPRLMNNASLACLLAWLNASYNFTSPETKEENAAPDSPLDFKLAPERPQRRK